MVKLTKFESFSLDQLYIYITNISFISLFIVLFLMVKILITKIIYIARKKMLKACGVQLENQKVLRTPGL